MNKQKFIQEKNLSLKWSREFDSPSPISRELLGNKGTSLVEMVKLDFPVPAGPLNNK